MTETTRALVLGVGGVVGTAWMAGLAGGLRRHGVDLAEADLIVGTSAGAIVGAALATGQDLDRLATLPPPAGPGDEDGADGAEGLATDLDSGRLTQVFTELGEAGMEPMAARRRIGRLALAAETGSEEAHIARMGFLIGAPDWPDRPLLVTAVDAETGELKVWRRAEDAPLLPAVASSCAAPGVYPPITIGGRRYMDGGIRSPTNADLAAGARVLVVIEPLAHLFRGDLPAADAGTVVTISADPTTVKTFGPDLHDPAIWSPAYQAGVRQAPEAARRLRGAWHNGTH